MKALRVIDGGKTIRPVLTVWEDKKEDFIMGLGDGEYFISNTHQLWHGQEVEIEDFMKEDGQTVLHKFTVGDAYHTTSRLREFCSEFHPEVDFDKEFQTHRPGVFAAYHEKFGYDYDEWMREQIYQELNEAVRDLMYQLPF